MLAEGDSATTAFHCSTLPCFNEFCVESYHFYSIQSCELWAIIRHAITVRVGAMITHEYIAVKRVSIQMVSLNAFCVLCIIRMCWHNFVAWCAILHCC